MIISVTIMDKHETERLATMETKLEYLKEMQETSNKDNRKDHQLIFEKIDKKNKFLVDKIDKFIEAANKTYATKTEVTECKGMIKDSNKSANRFADRLITAGIGLISAGIPVMIFLLNR